MKTTTISKLRGGVLRSAICAVAALGTIDNSRAADITSTWTAGAGNWADGANWSSTNFPNNGNGGVGTYDAVVGTNATITLDQDITIERFSQSAGTLTSANPFILNLNDVFTWTGGTVSGDVTIQGKGGIDFSGGPKNFNNGATINNVGAAIWSAGNFSSGIGAVFNNQAGATFDTSFDGSFFFNLGGTQTQFNNAGTFTKSAGGGTTMLSVTFNNSGAVNASSGNLSLGGGGTHSGNFTAGTGAALNFSSGTHNLSTGTAISGAGTVQIGGATWNLNDGTYNVTGTTLISSGAVDFNVAASTNLLTVSNGMLGGTGTLTASGLLTWTGGTMTDAGITQANGGMALSGNNKTLSGGRTLNNMGAAVWSAGNFSSGNGAVFNSQSGATFDTNFDGIFSFNLGGALTQFNPTFSTGGGEGPGGRIKSRLGSKGLHYIGGRGVSAGWGLGW